VNLNLAQVLQSPSELDERSRRALAEARNLLQEMSRDIRTLSYLLHPPLLDELGLASALKEYVAGFSERSSIKVEVDIQTDFERLPQEAETALFRIVQESLANIQRHSGSPTARIFLHGDSAGVTLEVTDEGHGITGAESGDARDAGKRFGVGILGMRERMAQLGGQLEIESSEIGTTVRATIPLSAALAHADSHSSRE
jgi:signal transduction histidine kinase